MIREAVRECKRLWKEIGKSGLSKQNFLASPAGDKWIAKNYQNDCPLCHYAGDDCHDCPLVIQYGKLCEELGYQRNPPEPKFFEAVRGLKE